MKARKPLRKKTSRRKALQKTVIHITGADPLNEREEQFRRAILEAPFPAMIHTEDGKVLLLSKAWTEITGYAQAEIPNLSAWSEKAFGRKKELTRSEVDRLFHLNETLNEGETTIRTSSGEERIWDFSVAPLGQEAGGRRLIMRMASDVTERNEAEKMLRKMQDELEVRIQERTKELVAEIAERKRVEKFKEEIINVVSHELRTPMAIIKQGADLLIDGTMGEMNEQQRKILAITQDGVNRLLRMVDSFLDMSKLRAGKIELKTAPMDLVKLAKEAGSSFEEKLKKAGLEFRLEAPATLQMTADSDRLFEVFTNLIGNALKFTEQGFIQVTLKDLGAQVECTVSDTGMGISKEDIPKVFEQFQQFGQGKGGEKGTGLGLAISQGLVELHGGTMRVESEVGRGTRFIFTLPKNSTQR